MMDVLILVSHSALIFLSHHITSHVSLLVLVLFMFVFLSFLPYVILHSFGNFFCYRFGHTVVPYHHFFSSACVACRLFLFSLNVSAYLRTHYAPLVWNTGYRSTYRLTLRSMCKLTLYGYYPFIHQSAK